MSEIKFLAKEGWLVVDLHRFLQALNVLYNRLYVLKVYKDQDYDSLVKALWNSLYYIPEGAELCVSRISISSPAEINLKGVGEIIRELRELWKDISFRNRQERESGEVRIFRNKVQALKEADFSQAEINQIVGTLLTPQMKLEEQADKYKIELIDDRKEEDDNE